MCWAALAHVLSSHSASAVRLVGLVAENRAETDKRKIEHRIRFLCSGTKIIPVDFQAIVARIDVTHQMLPPPYPLTLISIAR